MVRSSLNIYTKREIQNRKLLQAYRAIPRPRIQASTIKKPGVQHKYTIVS